MEKNVHGSEMRILIRMKSNKTFSFALCVKPNDSRDPMKVYVWIS